MGWKELLELLGRKEALRAAFKPDPTRIYTTHGGERVTIQEPATRCWVVRGA